MQAVTIRTGGRIGIPIEDGFSVDAVGITVIRMTGGTLLDHSNFVTLPWGHLMNVAVAILALNVVDEMGTRVMFGSLFFVTTMAGDGR